MGRWSQRPPTVEVTFKMHPRAPVHAIQSKIMAFLGAQGFKRDEYFMDFLRRGG